MQLLLLLLYSMQCEKLLVLWRERVQMLLKMGSESAQLLRCELRGEMT